MARPRRAIAPLDAEVTGTLIEADAPALSLATPVAAVEVQNRSAPPQRTPARQRLADALETVRTLQGEVAEASAELSKADSAFYAASGALSDAEAQLARSKPIESPRSPYGLPARSYWGSQEEAERAAVIEATPPMSIADARALIATAQDEVDTAQRLRQHWRARSERAEQDLKWRRMGIPSAVRDVLRSEPALVALAAECKRLATASAAANQAFSIATGGDVIQSDSPFYNCTDPTDYRYDPQGWSTLHLWREALEQLSRDPDAPLPMPLVA